MYFCSFLFAVHLVKADPEGVLSKGYCFVEYVDAQVTATAIQGLNGMDIGGGKSLTARLAGGRGGDMQAATAVAPAAFSANGAAPAQGQPPANRTIVHGYDIEALVDAAMGQISMQTAPVYTDAMGVPLTRIIPLALQVATAAAEAVSAVTAPVNGGPPPTAAAAAPSRVLVLHNMVQSDDLSTAEDHAALKQEVEEECAKFGKLTDVVIPRQAEGSMAPSAVGKIYLRYSTVEEANKATQELQGRQFGDAAVQVTTLQESDFDGGRLS